MCAHHTFLTTGSKDSNISEQKILNCYISTFVSQRVTASTAVWGSLHSRCCFTQSLCFEFKSAIAILRNCHLSEFRLCAFCIAYLQELFRSYSNFLNAIVSLSERSSLSQKSVKKRKLFAICDCDRKNFDNMCSKHAARSISSQNLDCLSVVSVHKEVL